MLLLLMSMGWDYVSELRPPMGLLFIPRVICEYGEPSHRGGPESHPGQSMWELLRTKWHWDRFFSEFFVFPCRHHTTVALQTHIIWGMNNMSASCGSSETRATVEWHWQVRGKIWITQRKFCPRATLSTTNPTWTDPGAKPGFHGERLATNCLNHGTAYKHSNKVNLNFLLCRNVNSSCSHVQEIGVSQIYLQVLKS
jgi:hypothetical protein